MRLCGRISRSLGALTLATTLISAGLGEGAIVTFNLKDKGIYPGAAPATLAVTVGAQIPGGVNNSGAGNEFNISYVFFDIDGDLPAIPPADPTVFYDLRIRTASFNMGQIVFDGFQHNFTPGSETASAVVMKGENSYLNFPFQMSEVIGDELDEWVRDGIDPGPPENQLFNVAIDEAGATRYYTDEGVDYFLGFKLASGNYGWIRAQYDSTATGPAGAFGALVFLDGAYNTSGGPIGAGEATPAAGNADFDGNQFVDGRDALFFQRGVGKLGDAAPTDGDANLDFNVDKGDLTYFKAQFGAAPPAISAIPEPASAVLVALAIAMHCRRRRS